MALIRNTFGPARICSRVYRSIDVIIRLIISRNIHKSIRNAIVEKHQESITFPTRVNHSKAHWHRNISPSINKTPRLTMNGTCSAAGGPVCAPCTIRFCLSSATSENVIPSSRSFYIISNLNAMKTSPIQMTWEIRRPATNHWKPWRLDAENSISRSGMDLTGGRRRANNIASLRQGSLK